MTSDAVSESPETSATTTTALVPIPTSTAVVPADDKHQRGRTRSRSQSPVCGTFELYFGVPYFSSANITLKEAVANHIFTLPLFMTLFAEFDGDAFLIDPDEFATTYFVESTATLTRAAIVSEGADVVSISRVRRRSNWEREAVVTWVVRPPRDMLENVGVAIEIAPSAFACGVAGGEPMPIGHVVLARRYIDSRVFLARGLISLGDIIAFLTAASSIAMVAHALQRSHVMALFFSCEIVDDMWYSVLLNPFQFELGPYRGSRPRGALFGNMCFVAVVAAGMILLSVALTMRRRRRSLKWSWSRCFEVPEPEVAYDMLPPTARVAAIARDYFNHFNPPRTLAMLRWPGVMFVPFSFVVLGSARAATELLRRRVQAGDVILALLGFAGIAAGFAWGCQTLRPVMARTVSVVVAIPVRDVVLVTRFDRMCNSLREFAFRFTTSPAAWFSRREGDDAADEMAAAAASSEQPEPGAAQLLAPAVGGKGSKKFVDKYGTCFDAFHTMGYWWALVDVATSFVIGVLTAARPAMRTYSCGAVLLLLALALSGYLAALCFLRPWSTAHNRTFSIAFALCNAATLLLCLFGAYTNDRRFQNRADTLDLVTNGVALLKLFFDMIGLLLLPSVGGFLGYIFGSTSYRMMRAHAWVAEMKRREKVLAKARAEQAEDDAEIDADDLARRRRKSRHATFADPPSGPGAADAGDHDGEAEDEEEEEEARHGDDDEPEPGQQEPLRRPGVTYRIVRRFRVVKRRVEAPAPSTPREEAPRVYVPPLDLSNAAAIAAAAPDDDDDDFAEEEEEALSDDGYDDDDDHRSQSRMSSLQRFQMI